MTEKDEKCRFTLCFQTHPQVHVPDSMEFQLSNWILPTESNIEVLIPSLINRETHARTHHFLCYKNQFKLDISTQTYLTTKPTSFLSPSIDFIHIFSPSNSPFASIVSLLALPPMDVSRLRRVI